MIPIELKNNTDYKIEAEVHVVYLIDDVGTQSVDRITVWINKVKAPKEGG